MSSRTYPPTSQSPLVSGPLRPSRDLAPPSSRLAEALVPPRPEPALGALDSQASMPRPHLTPVGWHKPPDPLGPTGPSLDHPEPAASSPGSCLAHQWLSTNPRALQAWQPAVPGCGPFHQKTSSFWRQQGLAANWTRESPIYQHAHSMLHHNRKAHSACMGRPDSIQGECTTGTHSMSPT